MSNELKLKEVFKNIFQIEISSVNDETSVDTVEKWDSLKHLNLVLALEEAFNITFTEEESIEIMSYPLVKAVLSDHGVAF
ncbi:acyl carrier protein [Polynucleobacter sphagniphilus]|uniref:acyl carrier protein n=1 Tax=Polynucleobacter sphagniphilus TaxID=1743169 RepID=UPI0024049148|nr:acyl carrier protein [Polynucleobacter sphagniphilus]MDF9787833.1 acyl carrier protein [Polynucleobacter sphagniphilus]